MSARVPVLGTGYDTVLHRRDARVKLLAVAALIVFLYVAPTWHWMLGATLVGLVMAAVVHVPRKWLLVLWLLQLPNFLGLIIIPVLTAWASGDLSYDDELRFGLRLGFTWSAALFITVSLFSAMRTEELGDGLRGLKLPEVLAFAFEYVFLLLYTSTNDILRVTDGMRLKGLTLEGRNPMPIIASLPRLMVPVFLTTARRASTMMATLQLRGFSFTHRRQRVTPVKFDLPDAAMLLIAAVVLGVAFADRVGVLELTSRM